MMVIDIEYGVVDCGDRQIKVEIVWTLDERYGG